MEKLTLRKYGKARNFFEEDEEFDSKHKIIFDAYELACCRAANTARLAIRGSEYATIHEARWFEAITATLEMVLVSEKDGKFVMPEYPDMPKL